MKAIAHTLLRLLAVQSAWTYEKMLGIGVAYASAPLLKELGEERSDTESRAMITRSAEFFNSHPYLAGVAVGALTRAERDRVPGDVILRLRAALTGPLGALGDQMIWAGQVPALIGLGLISAPWIGVASVLLILVLHNVLRLYLTGWGLKLGLDHGLQVGTALQHSWVPRAASLAQAAAALMIGMALPIATAWMLELDTRAAVVAVIGAALLGVFLSLVHSSRWRLSGLRYGLLLMLITLLIVMEP